MLYITRSELKAWINEKGDMLLVDLLPKESFAKWHLPGAVNIPFENNPEFVQQVENHLGSKAQRIVVYCANAKSDLCVQAAHTLHAAGLTSVQPFEDGVESWFAREKRAA